MSTALVVVAVMTPLGASTDVTDAVPASWVDVGTSGPNTTVMGALVVTAALASAGETSVMVPGSSVAVPASVLLSVLLSAAPAAAVAVVGVATGVSSAGVSSAGVISADVGSTVPSVAAGMALPPETAEMLVGRSKRLKLNCCTQPSTAGRHMT